MDLGLFVLHVTIGLLFVGHGLQKLTGAFEGPGLEGMTGAMRSMGLHPPQLQARVAALAETGAGVLLVLGLLTPFAAAAIIAVMVTASLTAHAGKGLWATKGGFELPLVMAVIAFAMAGAGPGGWSLDSALGLDLTGDGWALAALAAGIAGGVGALYAGRAANPRRARRPSRPATAAR
jgi:putative oxidoreductase